MGSAPAGDTLSPNTAPGSAGTAGGCAQTTVQTQTKANSNRAYLIYKYLKGLPGQRPRSEDAAMGLTKLKPILTCLFDQLVFDHGAATLALTCGYTEADEFELINITTRVLHYIKPVAENTTEG